MGSSGFKIDSPLTGGGAPGLITEKWDKVVAAYPDTVTETYTYSFEGTEFALITVIYTEDSKANMLSAERTDI